jgi:hypothetical protein
MVKPRTGEGLERPQVQCIMSDKSMRYATILAKWDSLMLNILSKWDSVIDPNGATSATPALANRMSIRPSALKRN